MTNNSVPEKKKLAPYKLIGWGGSLLVVIGVMYVSQFAEGRFPDVRPGSLSSVQRL